jgi:uncharacterized protein (TIGR02246 family)
MKRTSLVIAIAFLAGIGAGLFGWRVFVELRRERVRKADLAAIERLHSADIEATLKQDQNSFANLWSDDAVNLQYPGPAVVGVKAIREAYDKFRSQYPDFKVLKYAPEVKDQQIVDGWAIEVVNAETTLQISAKEKPVSMQAKVLRVLERQSDGSWKFARIASNN